MQVITTKLSRTFVQACGKQGALVSRHVISAGQVHQNSCRSCSLKSAFPSPEDSIRDSESVSKILKRSVKDVVQNGSPNEEVRIQGWVRAYRKLKENLFLDVSDGSSEHRIPIVAAVSSMPKGIHMHTSIDVKGVLQQSPKNPAILEVHPSEPIKLVGACDQQNYPFGGKIRYTPDYIRQFIHLRPKTNKFSSLLRLRSATSRAINDYFTDNGFFQIHVPILTSNDCEGAGELFTVKPASEDLLKEMRREVNPAAGTPNSTDEAVFFDKHVHLSVSGQLHLESAVSGLEKVWTFSPVFRAENAKSTRHLSEFYMVEAEMAFAFEIEQILEVMENLVKSCIQTALTDCIGDWNLVTSNADPLRRLLDHILTHPFTIMTFDEASNLLKDKASSIVQPGKGLNREQELLLVERLNDNIPVFVIDWPSEIKPFYMRQSEKDPSKVSAVDLLVPTVGELCGGSLREADLSKLTSKINATDPSGSLQETLSWYMDLRKYGGTPTGGFGLGFDRLMQLITGIGNIKDFLSVNRAKLVRAWPPQMQKMSFGKSKVERFPSYSYSAAPSGLCTAALQRLAISSHSNSRDKKKLVGRLSNSSFNHKSLGRFKTPSNSSSSRPGHSFHNRDIKNKRASAIGNRTPTSIGELKATQARALFVSDKVTTTTKSKKTKLLNQIHVIPNEVFSTPPTSPPNDLVTKDNESSNMSLNQNPENLNEKTFSSAHQDDETTVTEVTVLETLPENTATDCLEIQEIVKSPNSKMNSCKLLTEVETATTSGRNPRLRKNSKSAPNSPNIQRHIPTPMSTRLNYDESLHRRNSSPIGILASEWDASYNFLQDSTLQRSLIGNESDSSFAPIASSAIWSSGEIYRPPSIPPTPIRSPSRRPSTSEVVSGSMRSEVILAFEDLRENINQLNRSFRERMISTSSSLGQVPAENQQYSLQEMENQDIRTPWYRKLCRQIFGTQAKKLIMNDRSSTTGLNYFNDSRDCFCNSSSGYSENWEMQNRTPLHRWVLDSFFNFRQNRDTFRMWKRLRREGRRTVRRLRLHVGPVTSEL
ncbi:unnamed protein product [Orchesella dallaii]|uniref:asparagine--tRNA ligase n=1 Tax=Orchesella dallaii TaxID=48710 RepID=A0ABP1QHI3_9HEXA